MTPASINLLDLTSATARDLWAAAGFIDTLLRWEMKLEVNQGNEKAIQPGVQV